jgi:type II secretory pathway pseudopilin PulG
MAAERALARPARGARGLVLIALLLMLMLVSVGALAAAEIWSTARKHEREVELLWVGEQYRKAIESYWRMTPGARKILPSSIEQLLTDDRFPNPVHHLRQAYRDPMTEDGEFEKIVMNNALVGVHSTSQGVPQKHAQFPRRYQKFADAEDYTQWQFVFLPPMPGNAATPRVAPSPGLLPGLSGSGRH